MNLKFLWIPQEKKFHFEIRDKDRTLLAFSM